MSENQIGPLKLSHFQQGLRPEIRKHVLVAAPATFADACRVAKTVEVNLSLYNPILENVNSSFKTSQSGGKFGSQFNYPKHSLKNNAVQMNKNNDNNRYNGNQDKKCYQCGKLGHIANQCKSRNRIQCYSCGKYGHKSNECRTKSNDLRIPARVNFVAEEEAD